MIIHSSKLFTKSTTFTKTLMADISELAGDGKEVFHRLYQDSCDKGFQIVKEETGELSTWYLDETVRDTENDITEWILKPTLKTINLYPSLKDYQIFLFND